jgi:hypothetical protein
LKKISIRLIYPTIIWIVSTLIAIFYVLKNDGFGKGDIQGFSILTLIFSIASFFLYRLFEKIFNRFHILVATTLAIVFTIVQAIIFIYTAWFIFGPWLGAFSFPILNIWLIAIAIGNFYILTKSQNKFGVKHLLGIIGSGILAYGLILSYGSIQNLRTENQNFDLICLSWTPSDKTPEISDLTKWSLTEKESKDIIDLGIKGSFWGQRYFRVENSELKSTKFPNLNFKDNQEAIEFTFGNDIDTTKTSERIKIIVIMNRPQETDFAFKQSANQTIIVVQNQEKDGFKVYPETTNSNIKKIKIQKTDFRSFPYWTIVSIGLKSNNDFYANGFQWMEK